MERKFVENMLLGLNQSQAAKAAGYIKPRSRAAELMQKPHVLSALNHARSALARQKRITKGQVVDIVKRAVEIAELMGDPRSMISGAGELSKMFGFYEPERKEVELSANVRERHQQLQELSDEDLLALAGDEDFQDYIEGEYEVADQDKKMRALPNGKGS